MAPDQRLIGMDLIELRALAFGGDPAGAEQVGQRLSRAATALEQVSASLERAAAEVGLGWQGQAADAARTGIAGHAQWARTAAARTVAAAGSASAQAASATYVRANMPDPGVRSAATGVGGSPVGTDPVGTNIAQAEEAQRNAHLRAVELLEDHAAKSEAQRPTGPGTTATGGSRAAPPFTGERRVLGSPGPRPGEGVARGGTTGAGTTGAASLGDTPPPGFVNATNGTGPLPGAGDHEVRGPVAGAAPGVLASGPGSAGTGSAGTGSAPTALTGRRRLWAQDGPTADRAGSGHRPALPARHGVGDGVGQSTTQQQADQGGPGERGGHRPRENAEPGGVTAPPIGGAVMAPTDPAHRRLGFLIDEGCAFDGDPDGIGWVSPPVIGA